MTHIKTALQQATKRLSLTSQTPRLDAEVLLKHVLEKTSAFLYSHSETQLTEAEAQAYASLVHKRDQGEPIAYLIAQQEFWSLPFQLTPHTLIPRPETELLIETALRLLGNRTQASILELGTGSGAIALALASERPKWHIIASDISPDALTIATQNQKNLHIENVIFKHSDWFQTLPPGPFDAIISNPPYLAADDPHLCEGDVRFEPKQALVSGSDGLKAIRHILQSSQAFLKPNGFVLIEHGYQQKEVVLELFKQHRYKNFQCLQDLQGNDRLSLGQK